MDSPLQQKIFLFALQVIKLSRYIKKTFSEFDIIRQILNSGTSIGACIQEARNAQSPFGFISKLSLALNPILVRSDSWFGDDAHRGLYLGL